MAGNEGYHLGNCAGFSSALNVAVNGNVQPSGVFFNIGSVLVGHKLYVFGGTQGVHDAPIFVCDINSYEWNQIDMHESRSVKTPRNKLVKACYVHNDKLFVFTPGPSRQLISFMLDLALLDQWHVVTPPGIGSVKAESAGAYHEQTGEVVFCNGDEVFVFWAEDRQGRFQETKGIKPGIRRSHGCCMGPSTFFLCGGLGIQLFDVYALSLETMSWSVVQTTTAYSVSIGFDFSMSYINGRIFVMGGYPIGLRTRQLDVLEVKEQRWMCVHSGRKVQREHKLELDNNVFGGTRAHSAVVTRDKLLILGGHGYSFLGLNVMELSPLVKSSKSS